MFIFFIISFVVGFIVIGLFRLIIFIFGKYTKNGQMFTTQQAVMSKTIDVTVKKTTKKGLSLPCSNYVEEEVGLSIKKITKQKNNGYTTFLVYIHNLSEEIASFELKKAFYITSEGEQIEGDVRRLVMLGAENKVIIPTLKAERPIYFYENLQNITSSDILFVQLSFKSKNYSLATYIG